jgi:hypothetical protein
MANLYNKAGLINIPVGYSDGFLYNIKPTDNTLAFRFDRASSATRVNEKGLIEQVGYFGPELIQNGNFDTDSDWNKDTGWGISGGKASCDGSQTGTSNLSQTNVITDTSKTYRVEFTLSNYTAGNVKAKISNDAQGVTKSANGTYVEFLSGMSNRTLSLTANADFIGSIDNVSVTEVLGDKPRIDYTDSLTSPSFLLEPQSTNLVTYSEDFSQWTWGGNSNPNNTTRVDNQSSPDGGLNASLFTRNSGTSGWFSPQNITVSLNNTFTYSIFVKKNNSSTIEFNNVSNSPQNKVVYNIDLNTFTTETNAIGNSVNYGNGWYRISMTFEHTNSGNTQAQIRHTLEEGKSMFVFGSQAEQKSFATSYIPTSGFTVTRAAETCNGAGNASTFNSTEGVLYAEIAALADDLTVRYISLTDGTSANVVYLRYDTVSNRIIGTVTVGGSSPASFVTTSYNIVNLNKIAIKWKTNDFALWVNGVEVGADATGNSFSANVLNNLSFNRANFQPFYGNVKCVAVFKEALTDDELIALTS